MEILERLKTRHLLTSSAADSLARASALLEKAQELREAGLDYGDKCTELLEKSDPIMSLSKIALYLESEDSNTSYMDFPKSVFRQPYLPWELPRVYPGWGERRDLPEPRTLGSTNELPDLVDRNRCVGNAVQPLMAQYLFECIKCFDQ